jgi:hypothetical protein
MAIGTSSSTTGHDLSVAGGSISIPQDLAVSTFTRPEAQLKLITLRRPAVRPRCRADAATADVAGYELPDDWLTWRFTLREGLLFNDDKPVRSQDAVASIRGWAQRDLFGKRMASQLDKMKALDDRRFEIRLRKPFAHLPYDLGARPASSCLSASPQRRTPSPRSRISSAADHIAF